MKYAICTLAMAALLTVAGSSRADNGIPAGALNAMGLGGMTAMTDGEALEVRGMGAFAGGVSWAIGPRWQSGSINVYGGRGKYHASGAGGSIAGKISVSYKEVDVPFLPNTSELRVRGYAVFAGGFSTASAF